MYASLDASTLVFTAYLKTQLECEVYVYSSLELDLYFSNNNGILNFIKPVSYSILSLSL